MHIPKLLIHTFAENAVKHGIKHLEGNGLITICVSRKRSGTTISIQDNGVGRKAAEEFSIISTQKGQEIIDRILTLYFELRKIRIRYQVTDLVSGTNEPEGTEVRVFIPTRKS